MYLYSTTLSKDGAINQIVSGCFASADTEQLVVAKGKLIEFYEFDDSSDSLRVICTQEMFGLVRSLLSFRLLGMQTDFLVVGSDSGRIVVLEFNQQTQKFCKVVQETYGKSGCRRVVAGEYLAADPKGRALMIAAVEREKLVYLINRDSQNKLITSSPLEASKGQTLTIDLCGVDNGLENPQFAAIEIDYSEVGLTPKDKKFREK